MKKLWYLGYCESGIGGEFDYFKNVIEEQLGGMINNTVRISIQNQRSEIVAEKEALEKKNRLLRNNILVVVNKVIEELKNKNQ